MGKITEKAVCVGEYF